MMAFFAFLVGFAAMEGVAWATHRYVMHGPLWLLHRSHHRPRRGWFEWNDVFALLFAGVAMALIYMGARTGATGLTWAGWGATAYGFVYFVVHDLLVHGRGPFRCPPKRGWFARIAEAHHLHHATRVRDGAVSFGLLAPADPARLRARLAARTRA